MPVAHLNPLIKHHLVYLNVIQPSQINSLFSFLLGALSCLVLLTYVRFNTASFFIFTSCHLQSHHLFLWAPRTCS